MSSSLSPPLPPKAFGAPVSCSQSIWMSLCTITFPCLVYLALPPSTSTRPHPSSPSPPWSVWCSFALLLILHWKISFLLHLLVKMLLCHLWWMLSCMLDVLISNSTTTECPHPAHFSYEQCNPPCHHLSNIWRFLCCKNASYPHPPPPTPVKFFTNLSLPCSPSEPLISITILY